MDIIMLMVFSEHFLVSVKLSCSIYAEASLAIFLLLAGITQMQRDEGDVLQPHTFA